MERTQRERLVDSALDRALGPQSVEPRTGFEERILAHLAAAPQPRPWWRWLWIPALAAAAVLSVVIGLRWMQRETPPPVQAQKTVEAPIPEAAGKTPRNEGLLSPPAIAKHTSPRRRNAAASVEAASTRSAQDLPRQAAFPVPVPLTEQERLLLSLVNRQRPQAVLLAAEQQAEREKVQKYFETGEVSAAQPIPAQPMR